MTRRSREVSWSAILLVGVLFLGGCSDDPGAPAADPSSNGSGVAPEDVPSGDTTVDKPEGGQVVTSGELSEGYPSERVPVVAGKVLSSASDPDAGFAVTVLVAGEPRKVAKDATALLTERGFSVKNRDTTPGSVSLVLTNKRYRVELAATLAGGQSTVTYFVSDR
jgi:hypothetical protein